MANKPTKSAPTALKSVPKAAAKGAPKPTKTTAPKITIVANTAHEDHMPDIGPKAPGAARDKAQDVARDKAEVLKLKELLAAVVTKTGAKKKDAKDIVEAALAEITAALTRGHSLNLPPLGNLRVTKTQEKGEAKMMVLKLRIGGGNSKKDGLADDGDDS